jgi:muconolactone delta-isomerase
MDAKLMGVYNVLWETEKEKSHGRPRSFSPFDYPDIAISPQSRHPSSFLVHLPPLL